MMQNYKNNIISCIVFGQIYFGVGCSETVFLSLFRFFFVFLQTQMEWIRTVYEAITNILTHGRTGNTHNW